VFNKDTELNEFNTEELRKDSEIFNDKQVSS